MAFLLLTQPHSKYIEQLSRFILIIFQHPAQDICLSRTTPALPFFKEPLGGTAISVGLHVHSPTVNKVASFVWVSSFTMISRCRVFSRPSGESLTALPTVLNTTYHACSYFSLIGWRLKSIGMCFFMLSLFLNIFPFSPKIKQNYQCNSTRSLSYFFLKRIVVYTVISDVHWEVPCQLICDILRTKRSRSALVWTDFRRK